VAGEYREGGNGARGPVPDEFPRPRDSDDQQCDQQVTDELGSTGAAGFTIRPMPPASSKANVVRRTVINPSCRSSWRRASGLEKMDRVRGLDVFFGCYTAQIVWFWRNTGSLCRPVASRSTVIVPEVRDWHSGRELRDCSSQLLPVQIPERQLTARPDGDASDRTIAGWPVLPAS
jgi:hypothetical protein